MRIGNYSSDYVIHLVAIDSCFGLPIQTVLDKTAFTKSSMKAGWQSEKGIPRVHAHLKSPSRKER
jgi:hypothetical protein